MTLVIDLKAYSLRSNRGHSQNFQKFEFLHIFLALLKEAHFPKGIRLKSFQYEMRAIFSSLVHETLFNTVVYGSTETHIIMKNLKLESTEILGISFYCLYLLIHVIKRCC